MRVDRGVATVVHREKDGEKQFLILKRDKNWSGWEILKGHLEHDSFTATVLLELNEEAGIEPVEVEEITPEEPNLTFRYEEGGEEIVSDFRSYTVQISDDAEIDTSNNPSDEHADFRWVSKDEALELLEYEEQKNLLSKLA